MEEPVGLFDSRDRLLNDRLRERFVVTLLDGASFDGLLWDVDEHHLVLRDARTVSAQGSAAVDGELILPRDGVAYLQRP